MRKWTLMHGRESIITVEADSREIAKSKLREMGIDPDRYDYLLEYKPPETKLEYTPPGAKRVKKEPKQLPLWFQ